MVNCIHHHGVSSTQVADGGAGIQILRIIRI